MDVNQLVAITPTVYGIETFELVNTMAYLLDSWNYIYRLRYAPKSVRQQRSKATMRSAHLKYLSKVKVKQRWWSNSTYCLRYWNVTTNKIGTSITNVATIPTACGIETRNSSIRLARKLFHVCNSAYRSRYWNWSDPPWDILKNSDRCNSAYCLRYWNATLSKLPCIMSRCNSTYRLRYWNFSSYAS